MKLRTIKIHNFRCIITANIEVKDYMLLVGANNAGKSTILHALRIFYEDVKWTAEDFPKIGATDNDAWVQLTFQLDDDEWAGLADKYKRGAALAFQLLTVRRYFKSDQKGLIQKDQSNIYGLIDEQLDTELFYGAKNVGAAKLGQVIYIPAQTTTAEQTKMSGPSPLRNMLNFLLKKVVSKSAAYKEMAQAFEKLNVEARNQDGFLSDIATPLNAAIEQWGIKIDLSVNALAPEDISKSLVKFAFIDKAIGNIGLDLEQYGHGFQRSVIYELIRLAPTFKEEKKSDKKEFNPNLTIILFEEPEAFLHPSQQESMAFHLRRLADDSDQQVIITTHSPTFAGKAADEIGQLVRIHRSDGTAQAFQPQGERIKEMFEQGGELLKALQKFVGDATVPDTRKGKARDMIANLPKEEIALQEEQFRFQLWLDGERASLFFADRVLLVEGASERALFNYLLARKWRDLNMYRICVVDVLGKYNFHRFMTLLDAYGIPHGVILDDDNGENHQGVVNDLVEKFANQNTLATPVRLPSCLETFLGVPVTSRPDKKPIEIMKAITNNLIAEERLEALRNEFIRALALP